MEGWLRLVEVFLAVFAVKVIEYIYRYKTNEQKFDQNLELMRIRQEEQNDFNQQVVNNAHVSDYMKSLLKEYDAQFISTAKRHNGKRNSDASHQFKYSFKISCISEDVNKSRMPNVKERFQMRPMSDAPNLFKELKTNGSFLCKEIVDYTDPIMKRKLIQLGVIAFAAAETNDGMDYLFVFWFGGEKKASGISAPINFKETIENDFQSINSFL